MSKKLKMITRQVKPTGWCPTCNKQVDKVIRYGQLSYMCDLHWGSWDDRIKETPNSKHIIECRDFQYTRFNTNMYECHDVNTQQMEQKSVAR